jgi:hypothetical protein
MKKLSTYLFLLLFSFQTSSWADDIRDFEIEGISIGDSLLDYYSKEHIDSREKFYYPKSKKFFRLNTSKGNLEVYEHLQFQLLSNDKKYIIYSVSGLILYKNNIEDCYNFKNSLEREIKPLFPNSEVRKFKRKHDADKSGKSIVDRYDIEIDSGGMVIIKCSDWSDEMPSADKLTVGIISEELLDFVENEAYN